MPSLEPLWRWNLWRRRVVFAPSRRRRQSPILAALRPHRRQAGARGARQCCVHAPLSHGARGHARFAADRRRHICRQRAGACRPLLLLPALAHRAGCSVAAARGCSVRALRLLAPGLLRQPFTRSTLRPDAPCRPRRCFRRRFARAPRMISAFRAAAAVVARGAAHASPANSFCSLLPRHKLRCAAFCCSGPALTAPRPAAPATRSSWPPTAGACCRWWRARPPRA